MPKVSDEYRLARRRHILDAARSCFVRDGFHATSMDDVLTEAGMSSGALYGYFRSKNDIIEAIAAEAVDAVASQVSTILAAPGSLSLEESLRSVFAVVDGLADSYGRLAVQIWGEAQRDPAIAQLAAAKLAAMRGHISALVPLAQAAGQLPVDAEPEAIAQVLASLIPGYLVQRLLIADVDPDRFVTAILALRRIPAGTT